MSVVIGCDPHKRSHTAVAVNAATGELVGELTVVATDTGHLELLRWGQRLGCERRWAVEDVRHVSGRLQRALLAAGEPVVAVPPKLMAGVRRSGRQRGKSDAIDARAIALASMREPGLSCAHFDEEVRGIKLLLDHRQDLIAERTRLQNRLRWHLHELGMEADIPARSLDQRRRVDGLARRLSRLQQTTAVVICRSLLRRLRQLTGEITSLEPEISRRVSRCHPELLEIPGCGALTAAKLVAEIGGVERFASDAKLAMHAGVAPLPCSSGDRQRYRLNRSGNRQLNCALHRIAITQIRYHEPARRYLERKQSEGMSKREAIRALKRHLVRRVYNVMTTPRSSEGLT